MDDKYTIELQAKLDAAAERADKLEAENDFLQKRIRIIRNAKCPKCGYRFKIRK